MQSLKIPMEQHVSQNMSNENHTFLAVIPIVSFVLA